MYYFENHEELLETMVNGLVADDDSSSYLSSAENIRLLMREITKNTAILPDLIEFNTEDTQSWYYLSLDYSEFDNSLSYSIVNAIDDDGEFFVLHGALFVDESVPSKFYNKAKENINCEIYTVRIAEDCNGDCDNCPYYNSEDEDLLTDDILTDKGFEKTWYDNDGFIDIFLQLR